ncbi:hypothetical protein [Microbacterium nymphoidis]|uniref:hypothetical protein n=1 Tax=Microbacterium nymphoidis TaxID=2898586 RepID=UPI001E32AD1A|nr:hypothetical protein [Microbacterium nymphoidis]MCD2498851.1 hypothetical protein [Microbacterium nymphoidis]
MVTTVPDEESGDRSKLDEFFARASAPMRSVTKAVAWEIVSPPLFGFPGTLAEDEVDGTSLVGGTYWRSLPVRDDAQRPIVALMTGVQGDVDFVEDDFRRSHPPRWNMTAAVTVELRGGEVLVASTADGVARFDLPHDRFLLVHVVGAVPENALTIRETGSVTNLIENWETAIENAWASSPT